MFELTIAQKNHLKIAITITIHTFWNNFCGRLPDWPYWERYSQNRYGTSNCQKNQYRDNYSSSNSIRTNYSNYNRNSAYSYSRKKHYSNYRSKNCSNDRNRKFSSNQNWNYSKNRPKNYSIIRPFYNNYYYGFRDNSKNRHNHYQNISRNLFSFTTTK